MVPGATLDEKLANLGSWGYEGIEFSGGGLREQVEAINKAVSKSSVKVSTICAGFRGCPLDASKAERDLAVGDIKDLLRVAADIGAVGLIFVPIFGPPRIPDLSPLASPVELERQLLLKLFDEMGEAASKAGSLLLVEPLNRYETHLLNRLEQAVEVCKKVGNPSVRIMADFFHMSIEERDIPAAIRQAGQWINHVHLADSTRLLPGHGHTDFKSGFAALKDIGFNEYMALECGIPGPPELELPKSAEYMRAQM